MISLLLALALPQEEQVIRGVTIEALVEVVARKTAIEFTWEEATAALKTGRTHLTTTEGRLPTTDDGWRDLLFEQFRGAGIAAVRRSNDPIRYELVNLAHNPQCLIALPWYDRVEDLPEADELCELTMPHLLDKAAWQLLTMRQRPGLTSMVVERGGRTTLVDTASNLRALARLLAPPPAREVELVIVALEGDAAPPAGTADVLKRDFGVETCSGVASGRVRAPVGGETSVTMMIDGATWEFRATLQEGALSEVKLGRRFAKEGATLTGTGVQQSYFAGWEIDARLASARVEVGEAFGVLGSWTEGAQRVALVRFR